MQAKMSPMMLKKKKKQQEDMAKMAALAKMKKTPARPMM